MSNNKSTQSEIDGVQKRIAEKKAAAKADIIAENMQ